MRRESSWPRDRCTEEISPEIQSRMLRRVARRDARSASLPPAPNRRSKATRGSRIMGSGSVGEAQLSESVYAQE